ncbi:hypothetical protein Bca4012_026266 [Brassica carinata]|uniref:Uncharacterized protein n=1 Tax=Brassica carinata TaxID=52824 RepID=A0A8X7VIK4_BRACI|nr:hypothetical protein Bca52824_023353 [Brassica carinata]
MNPLRHPAPRFAYSLAASEYQLLLPSPRLSDDLGMSSVARVLECSSLVALLVCSRMRLSYIDVNTSLLQLALKLDDLNGT